MLRGICGDCIIIDTQTGYLKEFHWCILTTLKMEPENDEFQDKSPCPRTQFQAQFSTSGVFWLLCKRRTCSNQMSSVLPLKSWEKSWLFKFYTSSASSSNSKVKQLNKNPTTKQHPEVPRHPPPFNRFGASRGTTGFNHMIFAMFCTYHHPHRIPSPHPPPHSDDRASWHYSAPWDSCSTRSTWSWKFQELPLSCHCDRPMTWYHRRPAFVGWALYVHGD